MQTINRLYGGLQFQPERNYSITRRQFKAAYSEARTRRATAGIFAGIPAGELSGPGYYWTTPDEVASAALSIRARRDLVCTGNPWAKLERLREMDRLAEIDED